MPTPGGAPSADSVLSPRSSVLSPDELLATTRSVRRRLDLSRPVARETIEECLRLARQAPTGSNLQHWHFVVVTDPATRAALADLYRCGWEIAMTGPDPRRPELTPVDHPARAERAGLVSASAVYLRDHLHEVPVHVVPCIAGRTELASIETQAAWWGSIWPAAWSFMLAARARGLGTCLTTVHLHVEREAAALLGIPFDRIMQAGLIAVAHADPAVFTRAARAPLETMVHWEGW